VNNERGLGIAKMRLKKVRVQKYRSIVDTGEFEVEKAKTILIGPNEAGKTVLLQALQQINAPGGVAGFTPLRDYPRALYSEDIATKKIDPKTIAVVDAEFALEAEDQAQIPAEFHDCTFCVIRSFGNTSSFELKGGPAIPIYGSFQNDLTKLAVYDDRTDYKLKSLTSAWAHGTVVDTALSASLLAWLNEVAPFVEEAGAKESLETLTETLGMADKRSNVIEALSKRIPLFVLFSNYLRVKPSIHLEHLAKRSEQNLLDDKQYDYGNICLLKLLGFTPRQLADLGKVAEPAEGDSEALQSYKDQLDQRSYQLNAASIRLTKAIREVWAPGRSQSEADKLQISADRQYLKVAVEDDLGILVELDQRSEGLQWLVSFFTIFFAEAEQKYKNTILLLDEPGLSLHGLKQREFTRVISKLAQSNQTIYTTHSPFLVGPDELNFVRVVELTDRRIGTKVHTAFMADDPAALLPLQEALGYDLAQSLFAQQRNLILEELTDLFYLEAASEVLAAANIATINDEIALIPAGSASNVVYFATILHANNLKVAALLDSDSVGEQAAKQDALVHTLGNKRILRTKDAYTGGVTKVQIEELLRDTLITIVEQTWDVAVIAAQEKTHPIVQIFEQQITNFSKYKLAKAFVQWSRNHTANDLTNIERDQWSTLINNINASLA
jgi:predicted ATP-dependent endonuclease of OLD family